MRSKDWKEVADSFRTHYAILIICAVSGFFLGGAIAISKRIQDTRPQKVTITRTEEKLVEVRVTVTTTSPAQRNVPATIRTVPPRVVFDIPRPEKPKPSVIQSPSPTPMDSPTPTPSTPSPSGTPSDPVQPSSTPQPSSPGPDQDNGSGSGEDNGVVSGSVPPTIDNGEISQSPT